MLKIFEKLKQAKVSKNTRISPKEKINFLDQL
jgi:hypothetical protein